MPMGTVYEGERIGIQHIKTEVAKYLSFGPTDVLLTDTWYMYYCLPKVTKWAALSTSTNRQRHMSCCADEFGTLDTFECVDWKWSAADVEVHAVCREGLEKMRDVYEQNPKLGDAATLTKQLDESSQMVERLRSDIGKYEVCIGMVAGISL